jgi:hypothetical protein
VLRTVTCRAIEGTFGVVEGTYEAEMLAMAAFGHGEAGLHHVACEAGRTFKLHRHQQDLLLFQSKWSISSITYTSTETVEYFLKQNSQKFSKNSESSIFKISNLSQYFSIVYQYEYRAV